MLRLQQTLGNNAVLELLRTAQIQTKSATNGPPDPYEHEADRVAEQVVCSLEASHKSASRAQRIKATPLSGGNGGAEKLVENLGSGRPLDVPTRTMIERQLEGDFSSVRVHVGSKAAESARAINALAYTTGRDIVFGEGQYRPETKSGKSLIAHELAHVMQQKVSQGVQRKEIPPELQRSVDTTRMTEAELRQRYDLIATVLASFTESSPETMHLEEEAGRIGAELTSRALAAGRTFSPDAIERMRNYFVRNARKSKPRNCIDTMNDGLSLLYADKKLTVGDSVDRTMSALQRAGRAGQARPIEFEDKTGRISSSGARYPFKVHESVWDAIIQMNDGDLGWSVFGLGPADMSHSVTLTLDNNNPSQPAIYWSDQWSSKGGWKKYDKPGLDAAVAEVTQIIWNKKDEKHKPNTTVTLWRLNREPTPLAASGP